MEIHYEQHSVRSRKIKSPFGLNWARLRLAVGGILAPFSGGMIVSACAYGTDEEITTAGAEPRQPSS